MKVAIIIILNRRQSVIPALLIIYMSKTEQSSQHQLYELPECSICLNSLSHGLSSLKCGHVFHHQCISKFFEKYNDKCPNCQKKSTRKELNKLVFQSQVDTSKKDPENHAVHNIILRKANKKLQEQLNLKEKEVQRLKKAGAEQNIKKLEKQQIQLRQLHRIVDDMSQSQQQSELAIQSFKTQIAKLLSENSCYKNSLSSGTIATPQALKYKKQLQKINASNSDKAEAYFEMLMLKCGNDVRQKAKITQLTNDCYRLKSEIESKNSQIRKLQQDLLKIKGSSELRFNKERTSLPATKMVLPGYEKKSEKLKFGSQNLKKMSKTE